MLRTADLSYRRVGERGGPARATAAACWRARLRRSAGKRVCCGILASAPRASATEAADWRAPWRASGGGREERRTARTDGRVGGAATLRGGGSGVRAGRGGGLAGAAVSWSGGDLLGVVLGTDIFF